MQTGADTADGTDGAASSTGRRGKFEAANAYGGDRSPPLDRSKNSALSLCSSAARASASDLALGVGPEGDFALEADLPRSSTDRFAKFPFDEDLISCAELDAVGRDAAGGLVGRRVAGGSGWKGGCSDSMEEARVGVTLSHL